METGRSRDGGDFLTLIGDRGREAFEEHGRRLRVPAGARLLHQGESGDRVMLLLDGRVKISWTTGEGREVVLGFRGAGDLVGELSVIDGLPRAGSVTAIEPVEALVVGGDAFRAFLEREPRVAIELLRAVTRHFRDADRKRVEFARSDAVGRVAARLVELGERYGERSGAGLEVALPLSQEELAGWCGCSREAVVKALAKLRDLGWIESARRRVTILDEPALRERAA